MTLQLVRSQTGFVKTLDLSAVADGTELHGFQHWQVYATSPPYTGYWEIRGGELRTKSALAWALALWGDPSVGLPGHCVQAEVCSPGFSVGNPTPGLAANGALDHSEETRVVVWTNQFEWRERAGADWGSGFAITTGTTGVTLADNSFYRLRLASVQQNTVVGSHARGGIWLANTEVRLNDSTLGIGTGINSGVATYPGIVSWQSAGTRIRNYTVYRDYRISVNGLTGTQGFQVYNAGGGVLLSSNTQVSNVAWVDAGPLDWPFTGYIQLFNDAGTWASPVAVNGRWPAVGTEPDIAGGDYLEYATRSIGFQVNFLQTQNWPDEWNQPYSPLPTLRECDVDRQGSQGTIPTETCRYKFRDVDSIYVPANPDSPLAPRVQLDLPCRLVVSDSGLTDCLFFGYLTAINPFMALLQAPGGYETEYKAMGVLQYLANVQITPPYYADQPVYDSTNSTTIAASPLTVVLQAAGIPPDHHQIDPGIYPHAVGWGGQSTTLGAALADLARICQALYWVQPFYKTFSSDPNYHFRWQAKDAKRNVAADYSWVAADDGPEDISVTFRTAR